MAVNTKKLNSLPDEKNDIIQTISFKELIESLKFLIKLNPWKQISTKVLEFIISLCHNKKLSPGYKANLLSTC